MLDPPFIQHTKILCFKLTKKPLLSNTSTQSGGVKYKFSRILTSVKNPKISSKMYQSFID